MKFRKIWSFSACVLYHYNYHGFDYVYTSTAQHLNIPDL